MQTTRCAFLQILPLAGLLLPVAAPAQQPDSVQVLQSIAKFEDSEIRRIRAGEAVAKLVPAAKPGDVFVIGAVHIRANPERYLALASDLEVLRKNPQYLGVGRIPVPPKPADFQGLEISDEGLKQLQRCRPSDCSYQVPDNAVEELRKALTPAASADERRRVATAKLRELAARLVDQYQRHGDSALGSYVDKEQPVRISEQFADLASNVSGLRQYLPTLNRHLLEYPTFQANGARNVFYWEEVKFGLQPTTRINHMTFFGEGGAHVVAIKQLYANHYFRVALDISACLPALEGGFYLINWRGSRQDGLTGFKGSILRKVATGKVRSGQEAALAAIKRTLEGK